MTTATQQRRARTFREYHTATTERGPLVLPNAWDAASSVVYEAGGFDAVGTSSAAIAAAAGVPDGERLDRAAMLSAVERIANSVALPVSADIERGYGATPADVADTVRRTIDAGAVGVNLEDGTDDPERPLLDVDEHAARIRAAREAADEADCPLVVNGRTDVFWRGVGDEEARLDHAVERANAYAAAGSDCLFVPGVRDLDDIAALVARLDAPLNVLGGPGMPPIPRLADVGVARVSLGSGPMRATLAHLRDIGHEVQSEGTYRRMADAIPYDDLNAMLGDAAERRE